MGTARGSSDYMPVPGDLLIFRTKKWILVSIEDSEGNTHIMRSPIHPVKLDTRPFDGKIFIVTNSVVTGSHWNGVEWVIMSLCDNQKVILHEEDVRKYFLVIPQERL